MGVDVSLMRVFFISFIAGCGCTVYYVDDRPGFARRFDGIGGVSGGSATSKLLISYPDQQRNEILDLLFKPNFGASLQILKVEIGGDSQSSDGTESSHMHSRDEENYETGYEWWLMKQARQRNPGLKLYGLAWAFPGWVGNGTDSPYHDINQLSEYVLKWLQGARGFHGLEIDYIGIWNEREYNITYIKKLRQVLDDNLFTQTQIVAADLFMDDTLAESIITDPDLSNSIYSIGVHYPGTNSSVNELRTGKPIWASEDYSSFNNNSGGACWARILNQNYVNGFITSTIAWNLVDSYYSNLPWDRDALMTAREPWSGSYQVESPVWVTAHTTQFVYLGWVYLRHGSGVGFLENGGSYVTMTTNENINNDFAMIIETMTFEHSACIRPRLPHFVVQPQNITVVLEGKFMDTFETLNVWYTKLGFDGEQSIFFKQLDSVKVTNNVFNLSLGLNEVWTITNAGDGRHGQTPSPPSSSPFPLPYRENFEGYNISSEAYYFSQQSGVYEVVTVETPYNKVIRQVVLEQPIVWCEEAAKTNATVNLIGSSDWSEIYVEADVRITEGNGTTGVFIAGRVDNSGCTVYKAQGVYFYIHPSQRSFSLSSDLQQTKLLIPSTRDENILNGWNKMSLLLTNVSTVGTINEKQVFNITTPPVPNKGFAAIGTENFGSADFDNVNLTSVQDGIQRLREQTDTRLYFHTD